MDGDEIVATANTLLDSSITIGVSMEDVRAGVRNKLYGRYAHTSTFDLKLSDAMFDLQYLAMNTGSNVEIGGDVFYNERKTAGNDGKITLSKTARALGEDIKAYVLKADTSGKYVAYDVEDNKISGLEAGEDYCIRYAYHNDNASRIVINSYFIPKTLSVILEANLYSGGSCDVETATQAGKLQIKVYRFMLNGNQELSMTAAGVSQTSIEGTALASGCAGCDGDGAYAEIIQVLDGENWFDKASGICVEDAFYEGAAGAVDIPVNVYAHFDNAMPKKLAVGDFECELDPDSPLHYENGRITGTATANTYIAHITSHGMKNAMTIVIA